VPCHKLRIKTMNNERRKTLAKISAVIASIETAGE
jgi:hypothetical protein